MADVKLDELRHMLYVSCIEMYQCEGAFIEGSNPTESLVPLNLEAVKAEYTVVIWKIGT